MAATRQAEEKQRLEAQNIKEAKVEFLVPRTIELPKESAPRTGWPARILDRKKG